MSQFENSPTSKTSSEDRYTSPIIFDRPNESSILRTSRKVNELEKQREEEISQPYKQELIGLLDTTFQEDIEKSDSIMEESIESYKATEVDTIKKETVFLEDVAIPSQKTILQYLERKDSYFHSEGLFSLYSKLKHNRISREDLGKIVQKLTRLEFDSYISVIDNNYRSISIESESIGYAYDRLKNAKSQEDKELAIADITKPIIQKSLAIRKATRESLERNIKKIEKNNGYLKNPDTIPEVAALDENRRESKQTKLEQLNRLKTLITSHEGTLTPLDVTNYAIEVYGDFSDAPLRTEAYSVYRKIKETYPSKLKTVIDHENQNVKNMSAGYAGTQETQQKQLERLNRQRAEHGLEPLKGNPYTN
jgi:hypothetical protein